MARYFTQSWSCKTCDGYAARNVNGAGTLLDHTAGAAFTRRGIRKGDIVYVVSVRRGILFLIGKMVVGEIVFSDQAAKRRVGYQPWSAPEHLIASKCTKLQFDRVLPPALAANLAVTSPTGPRKPKLIANGILDRQVFRNIRELEPCSAKMLDKYLPGMQRWSLRSPSAWR